MAEKSWHDIVASSLDWEEAHIKLESGLKNLPVKLRGKRPEGASHSPWEILEHIRIAQADLLDFCTNPHYRHDLEWPADYWPKSPAPSGEGAWKQSIDAVRHDRDALKRCITLKGAAATEKIPWGTGQTFLRTVLVSVDHTSYHLGELVTVRRLLGAWPTK